MSGTSPEVNSTRCSTPASSACLNSTPLLLLGVFTLVNIAVLILRRDPVEHGHFRAPTLLPILGALCCAFLAGPWTGRDPIQYKIAGVLLGVGVLLWCVTVLVNRVAGHGRSSLRTVSTDVPGPTG